MAGPSAEGDDFAGPSAEDDDFAGPSAEDDDFAGPSAEDDDFAGSSAEDDDFAGSSAEDDDFAGSSVEDDDFAGPSAEDDDFGRRFGTYLAEHFDDFFTDHPVNDGMRECSKKVLDLIEEVQFRMDLPYDILYNGSQADGIPNYSDIDVMYCFNDFIVIEDPSQVPENYENGILFMEPDNCHPCYTRLRLYRPHPDLKLFDELFIEIDGAHYLLREKYIQYNMEVYRDYCEPGEIHGPAYNVQANPKIGRPDLDYVTCIKCPFWPKHARDFSKLDYLHKINIDPSIFTSFHVVPISHMDSKRPDVEFRLSFSVVEKRLHQQWTTNKMKFYLICKNIFKEYLTIKSLTEESGKPDHMETTLYEEIMEQKTFSSYHIKTMIYWFFDARDAVEFEDSEGFDIYSKFLEFIAEFQNYYLRGRCIRHYFMPGLNICDGFNEKQFRIYSLTMRQNYGNLPLQVKKEERQDRTQDEKLADLINIRTIEVMHIHSQIERIQTIFSYIYSANDKFTAERFEEITGPLVNINTPTDLFIFTRLKQCTGVFYLYDALSKEIGDQQRSSFLVKSKENFEQSTLFYSVPMNDYNITSFAYLALFYYLTDKKDECVEYILKGIKAFNECGKLFYKHVGFSIVLPSKEKGCVPDFFDKEVMQYLFFLCMPRVPVMLNPLVLMCYLHFRIFKTQDLLEDVESLIRPSERIISFALLKLMKDYEMHDYDGFELAKMSMSQAKAILVDLNENNVFKINSIKKVDKSSFEKMMDMVRNEDTREETLSRLFPSVKSNERNQIDVIFKGMSLKD